MYLPAKIKAADMGEKSTTIIFDVAGREVVFTCSNNQEEWQSVISKLDKFGAKSRYESFKGLNDLIDREGEINLVEVKTAFGQMPAITDFR